MKLSKTSLRELSHKYASILRKCAYLNAIAIVGIASSVSAYTVTEAENLNDKFADNTLAEMLYNNVGVTAEWTTDNITINNKGTGVGVESRGENSVVKLGNDNSIVNIASGDDNGILSIKGGKIDIKGKEINISTNSDIWGAVHAQNSTTTETDASKIATINISGENINITAPNSQAVAGMSQGIVNIEGNTTLKAPRAIVARGNAQVNINTAGDKTVKMDGDIDFNFDQKTSGTKVDAFVNVTLAGKDSYWKGNTTASYTGVIPNEDYLKVSSSKLTLKDGATWTATQITDVEGTEVVDDKVVPAGTKYAGLNDLTIHTGTVDIKDTTRGIYVDKIIADNATFIGGPLTVNKSMTVSGLLTLDNIIKGEGDITFNEGSSLLANLNGSTILSGKNITGTTALILTNESVGQSFGVEATESNTLSFTNELYNITSTDDGTKKEWTVTVKSSDELLGNTPASAQDANTIAAVVGTAGHGTDAANAIAEHISLAMQTGNKSAAVKAAKDLAPTTSHVIVGVAQDINNVLSNVAGGRMLAVGRSGGDTFVGGGLWVQGLYNHSKQDSSSTTEGFSADTKGISFGIDGKINDSLMIGLGYGYTNTDADSGSRDLDVDGHNFFLYSEYKPNNWYINGMLSYGFSKYTEDKSPMGFALKSKYDVHTYAANVMTGYDFKSGLTPEVGVRYLLADQESYNDGAQRISSDNSSVLTGVAGIKYAPHFNAENLTFKPTVRLAATYDFISDDAKANVAVIGGGQYQITGERLKRFGVETGIGVEASIKDWTLSLDYNGGFRKDSQSHTGMLKVKYHF